MYVMHVVCKIPVKVCHVKLMFMYVFMDVRLVQEKVNVAHLNGHVLVDV